MRTALLHEIARVCSTVEENRRFFSWRKILRKDALCGCTLSCRKALQKSCPLWKRRDDRLLTWQSENISPNRPSLAATVCTAVYAIKTWRTCSVSALPSKQISVLAKTGAEPLTFRLCIFVSRTPVTCCNEIMEVSTAHSGTFFALSLKIPNFLSLSFVYKIAPSPVSRLALSFMPATEKKEPLWFCRNVKTMMRKKRGKRKIDLSER